MKNAGPAMPLSGQEEIGSKFSFTYKKTKHNNKLFGTSSGRVMQWLQAQTL